MLVDKDKNPRWAPGSIAEVDESVVNEYFEPLGDARELEVVPWLGFVAV